MPRGVGRGIKLLLLVGLVAVRPAGSLAQMAMPPHQHEHGAKQPAKRRPPKRAAEPSDTTETGHAMDHMMDHGHMAHESMMDHEHHMFPALLGPYEFTQEASGTAWQPASSPHEALHRMTGSWALMVHGFFMPVWTHQDGTRGDEDLYASTMAMVRAAREIGPGRLGLRAMLSIDPATIGSEGYPNLLQTGETSDGSTPLIDRQHPHDLFMELGPSYSVSSEDRSLFVYGGLPGEPALGPPVFMHRLSGAEIPEAPISHHWLDSTHITYGVVTLGGTLRAWKLEASAFRGREPDHERWNIEEPKLDSYSFRLSWNPTRDMAIQASYGRLESPEELEPEMDTDRTTVSAMLNRSSARGNWQTTLAWGRNKNHPGRILDALLLESALLAASRHTFLARLEGVEKDELVPEGDPLSGREFTVWKGGLGYQIDLVRKGHLAWGAGVYGTLSVIPDDLVPAYTNAPLSGTVFTRLKIR
jgi:hypothetical protein